ncbi:MAG: hypothetical protein HW387_406 [Parachlamydiales bacterium]|nr:hypothetical protein [Parachlamydiales bacterium]
MTQRILQLILLVGAALFGVGVVLFFMQNPCHAQTPYYGPSSSKSGFVKVEIQVFDDPSLGGLKIEEASFNGQTIEIKPPGLHGLRGGGGFQVRPGSYLLKWVVSRSRQEWPRTVRHERKIQVNSSDVWIQVAVHGDEVQIL